MIAFILVSIFVFADLRTVDIKNNSQSEAQIQMATTQLNKTIKKHGLDKVNQFSTNEVVCTDDWKGPMGKMGTPWAWNKDKMAMRDLPWVILKAKWKF